MRVREAAVAGTFYPANAEQLAADIDELLHDAAQHEPPAIDPDQVRAWIIPHAGYQFSGPVAATAYQLIQRRQQPVSRVLLLGPSHRVPLRGIAIPTADTFSTPLGPVRLDSQALKQLQSLPDVHIQSMAHQWEHSLEVHIPFLQKVLGDFSLIPLVVGVTPAASVAEVLAAFIDDPSTLIVISSDLSHFLDYESAKQKDQHTSAQIEARQASLDGEQACGCFAINGLLTLAQQRQLQVQTLDLRNSGDTIGPRDQVVGYGSYAVY